MSALTAREVAEAYRTYGALVLRRCRRILGHPAAAEDALQEVFMRLWRYGAAYAHAESRLCWLYRVADRCCFDQLARGRGRREAALEEEATAATAGVPTGALEDRELVLRFLARFDERMRKVAVLHYLDQMTQDEIARETGWSRQTVAKKLALVRERAERFRVRVCQEAGG